LQLHFELRMAGLEVGQRRAQPEAAEAEGGGQADAAHRLLLPLLQLASIAAKPASSPPRARTGLAFGRGHDAPRGALEQLEAQPRLQRRRGAW
jgi:hypothetical protein